MKVIALNADNVQKTVMLCYVAAKSEAGSATNGDNVVLSESSIQDINYMEYSSMWHKILLWQKRKQNKLAKDAGEAKNVLIKKL